MSFFIRMYLTIPYYKSLEQSMRTNWTFECQGGTNLPISCYYETQETRAGPLVSDFFIQSQFWCEIQHLLTDRQGVVNLGVLVPKENGEIKEKDCGVSEANHRKIGIFTSKEDQNYKRVMKSIQDLIKEIETPRISSSMPDPPRDTDAKPGLRVLALGMTWSYQFSVVLSNSELHWRRWRGR
jgi:hypothetical protein